MVWFASLLYLRAKKFPISGSRICRMNLEWICTVCNGGEIIKQLNFFSYEVFNLCFVCLCGTVDDGINLLAEDTKLYCAGGIALSTNISGTIEIMWAEIATYSIANKRKTNILWFCLDNFSVLCYHMFVINSMCASGENPGRAVCLWVIGYWHCARYRGTIEESRKPLLCVSRVFLAFVCAAIPYEG